MRMLKVATVTGGEQAARRARRRGRHRGASMAQGNTPVVTSGWASATVLIAAGTPCMAAGETRGPSSTPIPPRHDLPSFPHRNPLVTTLDPNLHLALVDPHDHIPVEVHHLPSPRAVPLPPKAIIPQQQRLTTRAPDRDPLPDQRAP